MNIGLQGQRTNLAIEDLPKIMENLMGCYIPLLNRPFIIAGEQKFAVQRRGYRLNPRVVDLLTLDQLLLLNRPLR
jgi:hypothetical protein